MADPLTDRLIMKRILRNRIALGGIGIALLAVILTASGAFSNPYKNLEFVQAQEGEFILDVVVRGELLSERSRSVTVPSIRGNTQLVWLIPEGVEVEAGEVVARLDDGDIRNQLDNRELQLENAVTNLNNFLANRDAQLQTAANGVKTVRLDFELAQIRLDLSEFESVQQQQQRQLAYENALIRLDNAQRDSVNTRGRLDLDEMELRQRIREAEQRRNDVLRQLEQTQLKAPIPGIVVYGETMSSPTEGERKFRIGDSAHRGQTVITIPDLSEILVKLVVAEADYRKVAVGHEVQLQIDAIQDAVFPAHLEEIAVLASYNSQARESYFDARARLDSVNTAMRPGMTATVRIITDREEMALYIPNQAVFDDQGYTVVFPRSDLPNPRIVLLGQQNLDFVKVLEGLEPGEEISLIDPRGLSKKETGSVPTVGGTPGGPAGRNTPR